MKHPAICLALGILGLPVAASAQRDAPKHTCRIVFFNAPANAPERLHLCDGTKVREVELPRLNFSEIYELPAGSLTLTLLSERPVDLAKLPAGAPKVAVSAGVVDFYLLVTGDPGNKVAPVRMNVIDTGADKLRAGQMLWFNLSPNLVGGTVGSQKLLIEPKTRIVLDAPAREMADYPVRLVFRIPGREDVYPLCETRWRHDPRSRNVVFVYSEDGRRTPRVIGFSDFRKRPAGDT